MVKARAPRTRGECCRPPPGVSCQFDGKRVAMALTRARAWLAGIVALLPCLLAACGHIGGGVSAGLQPAGLPVEFSVSFSVGPDGSISLSGSVGIVTEVGVFSLSAHIETTVQPSQDETLLVIRHHVKGGTADTVYRVGQRWEMVVHLNGSTTLYVTNHKILIDATHASQITVENAPAPPPSSDVAAPPPGTLRLARTIASSAITIGTLSFSPDGSEIADAGEPGNSPTSTGAEVRRVATGDLIVAHQEPPDYIENIAWSPDGTRIATADHNCYCVQIWDARTGQTTATINPNWPSSTVSWSPDKGTSCRHPTASSRRCGDASSGSQLNTWNGSNAYGRYPAVWSPRGDLIVDGGEIWDGLTDQPVRTFASLDQYGYFGAEAWSPDGKRIASMGPADLVVWDAGTGSIIWAQQQLGEHLAWSPSGNYIAWTDGGLGGVLTLGPATRSIPSRRRTHRASPPSPGHPTAATSPPRTEARSSSGPPPANCRHNARGREAREGPAHCERLWSLFRQRSFALQRSSPVRCLAPCGARKLRSVV